MIHLQISLATVTTIISYGDDVPSSEITIIVPSVGNIITNDLLTLLKGQGAIFTLHCVSEKETDATHD